MSIYKNKKIIVLFLAPVTIGLLVFVYYPLIQTIIGSLYKWVSYSPDRKCKLFGHISEKRILKNTVQ